MTIRIFLASLGYLSALVGAPWFTVLCIALLAFRYRAWEAVLLGLCMDFLWLPLQFSMYTLPYFTIGSLLIVWLLEPLRAQFLR